MHHSASFLSQTLDKLCAMAYTLGMKTMRGREMEDIDKGADVITLKSAEEARTRFPQMLGVLAEAHLKMNGEYRCMWGGKKTLIKLA